MLTALARGELTAAWSWSDEPEKKPEVEEGSMVDTKPIDAPTVTPVDGIVDDQDVNEKAEAEAEGSEK